MNKKVVAIIAVALIILTAIVVVIMRNVRSGSGNTAEISNRSAKDDTAEGLAIITSGKDGDFINSFCAITDKTPDASEYEKKATSLAKAYEKQNRLDKAQGLYQKIIDKLPNSQNIASIQNALDSIHIKLIFAADPTPDSVIYEVQKGDSLYKIAKKFNTTIELLTRSNSLKNDKLHIGKKLKITNLKFGIVVDKSQNTLVLKSGDTIIKTYRVSTGKNFCTPVGTFKVVNRIENPTWYTAGAVVPADSPKNILGTRWLGLSAKGYGIHGTTEPESIGKNATAGCVRMKNEEVEELYILIPEGTEVTIID